MLLNLNLFSTVPRTGCILLVKGIRLPNAESYRRTRVIDLEKKEKKKTGEKKKRKRKINIPGGVESEPPALPFPTLQLVHFCNCRNTLAQLTQYPSTSQSPRCIYNFVRELMHSHTAPVNSERHGIANDAAPEIAAHDPNSHVDNSDNSVIRCAMSFVVESFGRRGKMFS